MNGTNLDLGKAVIEKLGGSDNIKSIGHCATRLRILLNNEDHIDFEGVKSIPGVLGIVKSMGGIQVIIGNNVNKVYKEIINEYNIQNNTTADSKDNEKTNIYDKLLNTLSSILGPTIPLIMTSGLISALLIIFTKLGMNPEGNNYAILNTASNVVFYFMPVLLAYTAAVKFKCNSVFALFFCGLLLHPNISTMFAAEGAVKFMGIPVTSASYSSTLIPIILTIWVLSYAEKLADKYIPDALKFVLKPLAIVLVMLPITLCVTGPAGAIAGNGLAAALTFVYNEASWLAMLIVSALAPLLVMTGMHLALLPLIIINFETLGFDNLLFVAFIGMNFSQFAVALAVMLKTKKPGLKQLAGSSALTAFLCGVTEPTLYGITIRLKKPLIATWIGCIANGIFCAVAQVKVFSFGAPSFFTMPIFINPDGTNSNLIFAIIAAVISIVITFAATWVLGFDDSIYE